MGIATEMLTALCADADDEKTLLYLSASDRGNQEFYKRFGFRIVGEGRSHPGAVHATAGMARMPRARADAGEGVQAVGDVVVSEEKSRRRLPGLVARAALPFAGAAIAVVWWGFARRRLVNR